MIPGVRIAGPAVRHVEGTGWRVRAPGKLVVLGEYAVLDGAPALVAAVEHGVQCLVSPGSGVQTPGDDRFVRAALQGAPGFHYAFSDWNPVDNIQGKPGFGGSAAATVAACLAAGRPVLDAFAVHAAVQGGGSGIDVYASIHGGLRVFLRGQFDAAPEVAASPMTTVWSGQSASTGPRVQRYFAAKERESFVRASATLVESFGMDPVGAVAEAYRLLVHFCDTAGIEYDLPAFRRIAALAAAHGGAAKPSGAGGGDIAVAVFPDLGRLASFIEDCTAQGLAVIDG